MFLSPPSTAQSVREIWKARPMNIALDKLVESDALIFEWLFSPAQANRRGKITLCGNS
jgi:hypothetical protein